MPHLCDEYSARYYRGIVDTTYPLGQNPTLARQYLYNIRAEYVDNVSDNVSKHIDIGWPIPQNLVVDS